METITQSHGTSKGNGSVIIVVLYILLAIILMGRG